MRIAAFAAVLFVVCLAAVTSVALAEPGPPSASPFANFVVCMKAQKSSGSISAADWVGWKQAFAACRDLLPKRTGGDHADRSSRHFILPTAAQVAAFKTCMAGMGFSRPTPGSGSRPDFRDPKVRDALKAALKTCLPQLKPASTG